MDGLGAGAALYPFAFDVARDALLLVRMEEAEYRAASFLDQRLAKQGQWTSAASAAQALAGQRDIRPLHFIFHAGHVGSTLLSRLLDETGAVLPLREPLPLRQLADAFDENRSGLDARLELLLRLWERGFAGTEAVVLKATSATERLAPRLMTARPASRCVLLNLRAETYLATLLAGEDSARDLNAYGAERLHRLGLQLGAKPPRPTTLGELAAMSWVVERLTQAEIERSFGPRVLGVDFDRMLETLPQTLERVCGHFGLSAVPQSAEAVLLRYSKAPEHAYGPELRRRVLDDARRLFPGEIAAALEWIGGLARSHPMVAAIL